MITTRITHDVQQGTAEWLRLRAGYFTASEAPAALGVGRYTTRADLLRQKFTGVVPEPDAATLARFRAGHDAEHRARTLAEAEVGGELYPVTMTAEADGLPLLASLDGATLDGATIWENKLWNEELAAAVRAGELPEHYATQVDQELLVSGATRCLFTCTDGSADRWVQCWYSLSPQRVQRLLDGWRRFDADLRAYVPQEAAEPAPVGRAPDALPALRIEVTGAVTASNLAEFKATALGAIRAVNRKLATDQDFADAERAVKWCADVESRLKAAKDHALSQTADIDALFRALDEIGKEARDVRLDLDKLVTRRKVEVKDEAIGRARLALDQHVATLNAELAPLRLQPVAADFAGAIKGLKSVASMQDRLDAKLAAAKIEADAAARVVRVNAAEFRSAAAGFEFLFVDLSTLVHKPAEDFLALVTARIATHQAAEDRKAREKAEADARAAEQQRQAAEAAADAVAKAAAAPINAAGPLSAAPQPAPGLAFDARGVLAPVAAATPRADEPATLKLGTICERLGFTVSADFLADTLGVRPARTDKAAKLYTERQFQAICRALQSHVSAMAVLYSGDAESQNLSARAA